MTDNDRSYNDGIDAAIGGFKHLNREERIGVLFVGFLLTIFVIAGTWTLYPEDSVTCIEAISQGNKTVLNENTPGNWSYAGENCRFAVDIAQFNSNFQVIEVDSGDYIIVRISER